ncbi:lytic transglycosylase domain-containing protein [Lysobacter pythonis]|uniref:Lytic transglycosylase domain-containing protein n=1 Tax=Solilutibacter pythonis TaxID=2483112 RepID=A0A3M2HJW5_9GAMM|nr:lytic transglycosylase domain-containing protein [Lysobacter pythonis]RMH88665.1 lytic transglycosylase domain-containing protein [Lysobacter pythonis]
MRRMVWLMGLGMVALGMGDALAGTLYRCDGPDGSRSYSSKRIPGASCGAVARYQPSRASRWQPVPAAAAANIQPLANGGGAPVVTGANAPAAAVTRRVSGRVYTYKRNGVTYATTVRPAGVAASSLRSIPFSYIETCFACGSRPGVNFGTLRLNTTAYQAEIAEAARIHGVEEAVIRAIMHAESAYNPNALSRVGAQGLMQLMPATARRFGVTNAFDPRQNIQGGVQYLAWLLKRFGGNLTLAAAGYNAGEGAVDRHKGVPPYNETQRYVERVRVLAERYRGQVARN